MDIWMQWAIIMTPIALMGIMLSMFGLGSELRRISDELRKKNEAND